MSLCVLRSYPRFDYFSILNQKYKSIYKISDTTSRTLEISLNSKYSIHDLERNLSRAYKYFFHNGLYVDFDSFNLALLYAKYKVLENNLLTKKQLEEYKKLKENSKIFTKLDAETRQKIIRLIDELETKNLKLTDRDIAKLSTRLALVSLEHYRRLDFADKVLKFEEKYLFSDEIKKLWSKAWLWAVGISLFEIADYYEKLNEYSEIIDFAVNVLNEKNSKSLISWYEKAGVIDVDLVKIYQKAEKSFFELDLFQTILADVSSAAITSAFKSRVVQSLFYLSELALFSRFKLLGYGLSMTAKVIDKSLLSFLGFQVGIEWYLDGVIQKAFEPVKEKLIEWLYGKRYVFGSLTEEEWEYLKNYLYATELRNVNLYDSEFANLFSKLPKRVQIALLSKIAIVKALKERQIKRREKIKDLFKQNKKLLGKMFALKNCLDKEEFDNIVNAVKSYSNNLKEATLLEVHNIIDATMTKYSDKQSIVDGLNALSNALSSIDSQNCQSVGDTIKDDSVPYYYQYGFSSCNKANYNNNCDYSISHRYSFFVCAGNNPGAFYLDSSMQYYLSYKETPYRYLYASGNDEYSFLINYFRKFGKPHKVRFSNNMLYIVFENKTIKIPITSSVYYYYTNTNSLSKDKRMFFQTASGSDKACHTYEYTGKGYQAIDNNYSYNYFYEYAYINIYVCCNYLYVYFYYYLYSYFTYSYYRENRVLPSLSANVDSQYYQSPVEYSYFSFYDYIPLSETDIIKLENLSKPFDKSYTNRLSNHSLDAVKDDLELLDAEKDFFNNANNDFCYFVVD